MNDNQNHNSDKTSWRTIRFLPDAPLDDNHFGTESSKFFNSDDAPRCEPVAEQLASQLVDFIQSIKKAPTDTRTSKSPSPPRIGLFGGLGQGKTTTIHWALWKVEQRLKQSWPFCTTNWRRSRAVQWGLGQGKTTTIHWALWKVEQRLKQSWPFCITNWRRSRAVQWFDTAFYSSKELEHELDRLLGSIAPSTLKAKLCSFGAYFSTVLLVTVICLLLPEKILKSTTLLKLLPLFGIGAIIAFILKPWSYWWRDGQRNMTLGTKLWWLQGYNLISGSIQILVIDNLDRANLEQQRAILRAIYKHHDQLGYAIIIGFDETSLLASNADPESPRELLRKSIHVEARMPVRVLTDTLRLAWMASFHAAKINPALPFLKDPRAVAALARVMALLSPLQAIGPRVAKHMVNNGLFFLAHVQKNEQPTLDDWRAVLRLLALYTALPQLRSEGDALKTALQQNTPHSLSTVLAAIFVDKDDEESQQVCQLVEQLFNATRHYNPVDSDWSPWVVLWATRAFATESFSTEPISGSEEENNDSKIPDFDSVNFLIDGLYRLVSGRPRTELSNITNLLTALPDSESSTETQTIQSHVANALLPLVNLLLVQLKQPLEQERLLTELWFAVDEGLLDWVFQHTDKNTFVIGLAELSLLEAKPWPIRSQQVFNQWWSCLKKPELAVMPSSTVRLLSLIPAANFHLVDIMAYAALAKNTIRYDIAAENWVASYNLDNREDICLSLTDNPVIQFLNQEIATVELKQFWPVIQTKNTDFSKLLMEHCSAWRSLNLQSSAQKTPLEYLLLEDCDFNGWLSPAKAMDILPALGQLFFDGTQWRSKNWLSLLNYTVKTGLSSSATSLKSESPLRTLHALSLRFLPLWEKPATDQFNLQVQIVLASSFPKKQALNRLAEELIAPLSVNIALVVIENIQSWSQLSASAWAVKHPQNPISDGAYKTSMVQSWVTGLLPNTWSKLFGGDGVNELLPGGWQTMYTDRNHQ